MGEKAKTRERDSRRLRYLWIAPRYQGRYLALLISMGASLAAALTWVFYRFTFENYSVLVDLAPLTDAAREKLYHEFMGVVGTMAVSSAIFLLACAILGLVLSHRAAGPLFHFRRIFEKIEQGETSARIQLRPGDDFQDVAASFNKMMDRLEKERRS